MYKDPSLSSGGSTSSVHTLIVCLFSLHFCFIPVTAQPSGVPVGSIIIMSALSCFLSLRPLIYLKNFCPVFAALYLRPTSPPNDQDHFTWYETTLVETACLAVNMFPSLSELCMVMICCPPTEETPASPFWISLTLFACPLCYISPAIKIPRSSGPVLPNLQSHQRDA